MRKINEETSGRTTKSFRHFYPAYIDKINFTNKINIFRDQIANRLNGIFHEPAANMKVINWDEELQYFAVNSVNTFDISSKRKGALCGTTVRYSNVSIVTNYYRNVSELDVFGKFLNSMKSTILQGLKRSERFSMLIDAETESVGCAIIEYEISESKVFAIQCLFNRDGGKQFDDIYQAGGTCTKCSCIEKCSKYYSNLCTYRNMEGQPLYCKKQQFIVQNNTSLPFCESESNVNILYVHFHIVYSLIFVAFVIHMIFFSYFKSFENFQTYNCS